MRKLFEFFLLLFFIGLCYGFELEDKIGDWKWSEKPLHFGPDNLYRHIDGDADSFLKYGFVGLDVFYYRKAGHEMKIEIFNMGSPINAVGVFRARIGISRCRGKYGLEDDVEENQVIFIKGKYYINIYTYHLWNGAEGEIDRMAKHIEAKINAKNDYPKEFHVFPEDGLIRCSFGYYPKEYMGLKGLKNIFEAMYSINGKKIRLFYTHEKFRPTPAKTLKYKSYSIDVFPLPTGKKLYFINRCNALCGTDSSEGFHLLLIMNIR